MPPSFSSPLLPMSAINIRTEIPGPVSRALMQRREAAVPRGVPHAASVFAASASGARVVDVDVNNVIRFLAPLTIADGELDEGLEVLAGCFMAACPATASG